MRKISAALLLHLGLCEGQEQSTSIASIVVATFGIIIVALNGACFLAQSRGQTHDQDKGKRGLEELKQKNSDALSVFKLQENNNSGPVSQRRKKRKAHLLQQQRKNNKSLDEEEVKEETSDM